MRYFPQWVVFVVIAPLVGLHACSKSKSSNSSGGIRTGLHYSSSLIRWCLFKGTHFLQGEKVGKSFLNVLKLFREWVDDCFEVCFARMPILEWRSKRTWVFNSRVYAIYSMCFSDFCMFSFETDVSEPADTRDLPEWFLPRSMDNNFVCWWCALVRVWIACCLDLNNCIYQLPIWAYYSNRLICLVQVKVFIQGDEIKCLDAWYAGNVQ